MSTSSLRSALVPPALAGQVCLSLSSIPRFWASIWIDVLTDPLKSFTKKRYLNAVSRRVEAAERQCGTDCLERLLADLDFDTLEDILVGFLCPAIA
jgi:hypothetical protein